MDLREDDKNGQVEYLKEELKKMSKSIDYFAQNNFGYMDIECSDFLFDLKDKIDKVLVDVTW